jgi:hypothetical protein
MAKLYFVLNPHNISELKMIREKCEAHEYMIEKIIEINGRAYRKFTQHLLDDDFIVDHLNLMYLDADDVQHCILVTVSGAVEGVLVADNEYGRNAAFWSYIKEGPENKRSL